MNICIGNLPRSMDHYELRTLLRQYGEVKSVTLVMDRVAQGSRGFGFTVMSSIEEGEAVVACLHGAVVRGRKLVVNEVRRQPR